MAVAGHTGTIIALAGRGEVSAKNRSAELDETSLRPGAVSSAVFCDIRRDPPRLIAVRTITALHDDHCFPITAPSERSAVFPRTWGRCDGRPYFFRENGSILMCR